MDFVKIVVEEVSDITGNDFPNCRVPDNQIFANIEKRHRENGSFEPRIVNEDVNVPHELLNRSNKFRIVFKKTKMSIRRYRT